jgi:hypothetical protein
MNPCSPTTRVQCEENVMLCENGVEELNVVGFCSRETMHELFGLHFFPSVLLLCHSLRDMYYEMSKYWSSKVMLQWFWSTRWTSQ